jgi:hypothetical protein
VPDRGAQSARTRGLVAVTCALAALAAAPADGRFKPRTLVAKPYVPTVRLPVVGAAKALRLFAAQREATGLPSDLAESTALSAGCRTHVTMYHPYPGEFPHEEDAAQPGYTPAGALAAAGSSLSGRPNGPYNVGGDWTRTTNPWTGASLHEASLMSPEATSAWYGGARSAVCMGTAGRRTFSGPTFFAYPGQDAKGVPTWIVAEENPFTVQQAVGMKNRARVGQAIVLWPVRTASLLQSATIVDEKGKKLPTKVVLPTTPIPDISSHPGFPQSGPISQLTGPVSYVVPTVRYRPRTTYTLTARWVDSAGVARIQTSSFTTGRHSVKRPLERAKRRFARRLDRPGLRAAVNGRRLTIRAIGAARGERVRAFTTRCADPSCEHNVTPWEKKFRLRSRRTTIRIPKTPSSGSRTLLTVRLKSFSTSQADFVGGQTTALLPLPGP